MAEAFRLLNHHGMKIWVSTLFGGLVVTVLLLVPHLFMGMMLGSQLPSVEETLKSLASEPGMIPKLYALAQTLTDAFATGGSHLIGYAVLVVLLSLLGWTFFLAGLTSSVRDAAVHNKVMLGRFFSGGIRYLFPLLALGLLYELAAGVVGALAALTWPLVEGEFPFRIAWLVVIAFLSLIFLIASSHSMVVLFSDHLGVLRSFASGFKIAILMFGRAFASLLGAAFSALLGMALVLLLSLFPWIILRFFEDGAVAMIVSSLFGGFLFLVLGLFPVILSLGVLFRRYLIRIQDDLFPEDHLEAVMLQPDSSGDDWNTQEEHPSNQTLSRS
ncbi:hypothetical protein [Salinithrix halophila]|uniref:Membrane domain of glycerophosphoryl diester phosphodiesterase n=1 Tax=Salinithrix halophila TaxID=1485204 RepID=A0ABV8JBE6_9BACL